MKQVIIVNESLNLPKGKLAAQVAHAAVATTFTSTPAALNKWVENGMPKIVLKVRNEEELKTLKINAENLNINHQLIRDAGKTVVSPGTVTCLGLGPEPSEKLDKLTKNLTLL